MTTVVNYVIHVLTYCEITFPHLQFITGISCFVFDPPMDNINHLITMLLRMLFFKKQFLVLCLITVVLSIAV